METDKQWTTYAVRLATRIQTIQDDRVYPLARQWRQRCPDRDAANDARIHWFIGAARALNNFKLGYICVAQMGDSRWWQAIVKGSPPPESDLKDWIREFETSIIWAYVHGVFTITEETLRLVSSAMGGSEVSECKSIYAALLKRIGLQRLEALLDLCRLIRNTTHTNGFFLPRNGKDVTVEWKGVKYEFRVGQSLAFGTPEFLMETFGRELTDCFDLIMSAPAVEGLSAIPRRVRMPR